MSHPTHHLFLSYSRRDNIPNSAGGEGWVTAFYRRLQAQHREYAGRELSIFFDTEEIEHGSNWQARIGQGLRTSRLFIAFLSPNYMRSVNCRWEWEEYLRREHSLARGEDGIRTIFFEIVPGIPDVDGSLVQSIEEELRADHQIARWLDMIAEELARRNAWLDPQEFYAAAGGLHPRAAFDLRPWFSKGPQILAELDAAERLAELRRNPALDHDQILTLADRLKLMDVHISTRLDRCLLAELAPGRHSLGRSYPHFVGRHKELRNLHQSLIADRIGLVTAVHGLGGQGKTALAIQYAHAYADFYAAGGRWVIPCEGVVSMADAMMRLATQVELRFEVPADIQAEPVLTVQFVLLRLEQLMEQNAATLGHKLSTARDRMSRPENLPQIIPRTLIILDNVDQPQLLAADQLKLLPQSEWFELIVTTRLDPERFGIGRDLRPIPVDSLPIDDAVALIRDFQPDQQFAGMEDEAGARQLCETLGGFTLSVELAAAYLGQHPDVRPGDYCSGLLQQGLPTVEKLAEADEVAAQIRHREKQFSIVANWTLSRLDERARFVLEHASFLEPDSVMLDWLREIAGQRYPELLETQAIHATAISPVDRSKTHPWLEVWRQLKGLRLLTPGDEGPVIGQGPSGTHSTVPGVARIHRLIAAHISDGLAADAAEACWQSLIPLTDRQCTAFQESWQHSAQDHWKLRAFGDNALHLARQRPLSRELAENCGVIGQAEMTLGSLSRAEQLVRQCSGNLRQQYELDEADQQISRVFSVSLNVLGDFYRARGQAGDAELALEQFEEAFRIAQQLFAANPNSAQAARDLSVSLDRLGDFYRARGQARDAELALKQFEEALRIDQQLFTANPNSAQAARDLSVSLDRLGDFYRARGQAGDAELALKQFEEALAIRRQLFSADPNSAHAARDLSVSLNRLGDFYRARGQAGDAELALEQFEEALRIAQQLFAANPNSAQAARDLSVFLNRLGDFYRARGQAGDAELALKQFEESIRIDQQLFTANPNSAEAARDLLVSLERLSDVTFSSDAPAAISRALELQAQAVQIARALHEANPASLFVGRTAVVSAFRMSQKARKAGDAELAGQSMVLCHSILHTLIQQGCKLDAGLLHIYNYCEGIAKTVSTRNH